ncbi:prenyltransferase [Halobium salinum]|nr:prenyltransferase [Halobium salinum]
MSRPDQLLLMVVVYGMGVAAAVADGRLLPTGRVALAFLAYLPLAAGVHYANEFADYGTDLLTERTRFSGGSGALARTGLSRRLALRATAASLLLGTVATLTLATVGVLGGPVLALLLGVVVFGVGYSLPPLALAWRGLGEVDNATLGGLVLPTYGFVAVAGSLSLDAVVAFVPFALFVFANLLATGWPDREADAAVGKRTLPTRLPTSTLRWLHAGALLAGFVALGVLHGGHVPTVVCWATMLAAPPFLWGVLVFTRQRSPLPTVAGMVVVALAQFGGWVAVVL